MDRIDKKIAQAGRAITSRSHYSQKLLNQSFLYYLAFFFYDFFKLIIFENKKNLKVINNLLFL